MKFTPVLLDDDMDYLMRPVLARMIHISDLDDGRVTLDHIAELHDALDARDENGRRANAAMTKG